jgi:hypothetical protein
MQRQQELRAEAWRLLLRHLDCELLEAVRSGAGVLDVRCAVLVKRYCDGAGPQQRRGSAQAGERRACLCPIRRALREHFACVSRVTGCGRVAHPP